MHDTHAGVQCATTFRRFADVQCATTFRRFPCDCCHLAAAFSISAQQIFRLRHKSQQSMRPDATSHPNGKGSPTRKRKMAAERKQKDVQGPPQRTRISAKKLKRRHLSKRRVHSEGNRNVEGSDKDPEESQVMPNKTGIGKRKEVLREEEIDPLAQQQEEDTKEGIESSSQQQQEDGNREEAITYEEIQSSAEQHEQKQNRNVPCDKMKKNGTSPEEKIIILKINPKRANWIIIVVGLLAVIYLVFSWTYSGQHNGNPHKIKINHEKIIDDLNLKIGRLENHIRELDRNNKELVKEKQKLNLKIERLENNIRELDRNNKELVNENDELKSKISGKNFANNHEGGKVLAASPTRKNPIKRGGYIGFIVNMVIPSTENQGPELALSESLHPGQNWAMQGNQGHLLIELSTTIKPKRITVEHAKHKDPSLYASAPKNFEIYAANDRASIQLQEGAIRYGEIFGRETNFNPAEGERSFENTTHKSVKYVLLKINENRGNPNFTSIYGVRVYGKPIED